MQLCKWLPKIHSSFKYWNWSRGWCGAPCLIINLHRISQGLLPRIHNNLSLGFLENYWFLNWLGLTGFISVSQQLQDKLWAFRKSSELSLNYSSQCKAHATTAKQVQNAILKNGAARSQCTQLHTAFLYSRTQQQKQHNIPFSFEDEPAAEWF